MTTPKEALGGLKILNLSQNIAGAIAGQFMADHGAEVVLVEPPGGSPLRAHGGWPLWARGSRSLESTLSDPAVRAFAEQADVIIDTFRPGVTERHGLGHDELAKVNPKLVTATITAFGRDGPLSHLRGYEGVVMAKIGAYSQFSALVDRPGPAFANVPYCSSSASLLAVTGILAALYERETSGVGQRVDATLIQAIASHDTWNWMIWFAAQKFPEAFATAPTINEQRRVPNSWLLYSLLQGLTKDGRWLQFSQCSPKLFKAFLVATDLDGPAWEDAWEDEDLERREAFWDRLLNAVRSRTVAEWQALFDAHPDVFAEIYRSGSELLRHPQLVHDDQIAVTEVEGLGEVRTLKPLVRLSKTPGRADRPVPTLDESGAALRARHAPRPTPVAANSNPHAGGYPLAGVTIVDLGGFYAGPYGLSVLADLGARVIKVEPLEGDVLRMQVGFPGLGGVKVMQGKECVAIDLTKPEGRDILLRLVRKADLVMQNFRQGVAERLGVDAASLLAINPDMIYHEAPGFGVSGPYAKRPAYAPTIAAGAGMARRNAESIVPESVNMTLDEIKDGAIRLSAACLTVGHPDGFAALGVACAEALALYARKRGLGAQGVVTTMLSTVGHVLSEDMVEYAGRPATPRPDSELLGLGPLYRLYEAAEGWVFLAALSDREWALLVAAIPDAGLDAPRFATGAGRHQNADALSGKLAAAFRAKSAEAWERELVAADIACVAVNQGPSHETIMKPDGLGYRLGMVTETEHPVFGLHPRLKSLLTFSRSATRAEPSPVIGCHTAQVLREFGYSDAELDDLVDRQVVGVD